MNLTGTTATFKHKLKCDQYMEIKVHRNHEGGIIKVTVTRVYSYSVESVDIPFDMLPMISKFLEGLHLDNPET